MYVRQLMAQGRSSEVVRLLLTPQSYAPAFNSSSTTMSIIPELVLALDAAQKQ